MGHLGSTLHHVLTQDGEPQALSYPLSPLATDEAASPLLLSPSSPVLQRYTRLLVSGQKHPTTHAGQSNPNMEPPKTRGFPYLGSSLVFPLNSRLDWSQGQASAATRQGKD